MIWNVNKDSDLLNFDNELCKYENYKENISLKVINNKYLVKLFYNPKRFQTELDNLLKLQNIKGIPKVIAYSETKEGIKNTNLNDIIDNEKQDIVHLSVYFRNDEGSHKKHFSNTKENLKKTINNFFTEDDIIERVNYTTYIIMEKIDGEDLFDYYIYEGPDEEELKSIFYPLLKIIEKMHSLNIIHKDIKPENILYDDKNKKVYLIDFEGRTTKEYRSIEVLQNANFSEKSDMFSIGATLYALFHHRVPFKNENFTKKVRYSYNCSHEFQDLLESLLDLDPSKRPTASEVLEHSWFF